VILSQAQTHPETVPIVVLVLDYTPDDSYRELKDAIKSLKKSGIHLVSVGAFDSNTLDDNKRQLLSYYRDMIFVNESAFLSNVINRIIEYACPFKGELDRTSVELCQLSTDI
jgi:ABC-type uncharacterized transport system substrate-binding protein